MRQRASEQERARERKREREQAHNHRKATPPTIQCQQQKWTDIRAQPALYWADDGSLEPSPTSSFVKCKCQLDVRDGILAHKKSPFCYNDRRNNRNTSAFPAE